jgi:hypothetical protein
MRLRTIKSIPEAQLEYTESDVDTLLAVAEVHPDPLCREAACSGFLRDMKNGQENTVYLDLTEMQVLGQIAEHCSDRKLFNTVKDALLRLAVRYHRLCDGA